MIKRILKLRNQVLKYSKIIIVWKEVLKDLVRDFLQEGPGGGPGVQLEVQKEEGRVRKREKKKPQLETKIPQMSRLTNKSKYTVKIGHHPCTITLPKSESV